ncbi:MAG: response regulator transcription factor [Clostridia bacterium]|nr:response regulator transcription factor [Clostridia bacterium]
MYRVAVCDDESVHAEWIGKTISGEFEKQGETVSVSSFTGGRALQSRLSDGKSYDVFFLDIDMPDMDGIALCRHIRKLKGDALVVFISNREEMVFQVFEVAPFRFVRKSRFNQEIGRVTRDLLVELRSREARYLKLQDERSDTVYVINARDVLYIEALRKQCEIHTRSETIRLTIQFGKVMECFSPYHFIQIHRSYLVNPNFIHRINAESVRLDSGAELPLSRSRRQEVRDAFFTWSREGE